MVDAGGLWGASQRNARQSMAAPEWRSHAITPLLEVIYSSITLVCVALGPREIIRCPVQANRCPHVRGPFHSQA